VPDAIGRRILRALQCDGRISNVELAREVALNPAACSKHAKRWSKAA
jgi:Lrp/AsnC family leucine-responsive transcriptional regulator